MFLISFRGSNCRGGGEAVIVIPNEKEEGDGDLLNWNLLRNSDFAKAFYESFKVYLVKHCWISRSIVFMCTNLFKIFQVA